MKYIVKQFSSDGAKHLIPMENKTPTRTTRHRGYGFGVTFSMRRYHWNQSFSLAIRDLFYSDYSVSA